MADVRRKTWGVVCGMAALVLGLVALVVIVSKARVLLDHPVSAATFVLAVALVGTIACTREARRALT